MFFRLYLFLAAKKTSTPGDLVSELKVYDFPASQETETFARELQRRLPQKSAGLTVSCFFHIVSAAVVTC